MYLSTSYQQLNAFWVTSVGELLKNFLRRGRAFMVIFFISSDSDRVKNIFFTLSHLHIYLGFRFVIMWYCSMCRHNVIIIVWTCHKCHNSDLQSIQHIFTTAKELIYIVHQWYSNGKITLLNVTWCRHSVCTDGLTLSCWILTVTDTAGNLDQCSNEFIKSLISSKALHFHQDSHGI